MSSSSEEFMRVWAQFEDAEILDDPEASIEREWLHDCIERSVRGNYLVRVAHVPASKQIPCGASVTAFVGPARRGVIVGNDAEKWVGFVIGGCGPAYVWKAVAGDEWWIDAVDLAPSVLEHTPQFAH